MKNILITGANGGIGSAIAKKLASKNTRLFLIYHNNKDILDNIRQTHSSEIYLYQCNLTKEKEIKALIDDIIYKFKKIDVLINAHGVSLFQQIQDTSEKDYNHIFDTNFKSIVFTIKHVAKHMISEKYGNIINISLKPSKNNTFPEIKNKSDYQITIVNMLKNGDKNNIRIVRQPWIQSDMVYLKGTIKTPLTVQLPVNQLERNFKTQLQSALKTAKISPKGTIKVAPMQEHTELILEHVSKPLDTIVSKVLKDSNNLYAEMIFKTSGAKFSDSQGTTAAGIDFFNNYYKDINTKTKPVIADGSGASRNDLITADWMTEALNKIYKNNDFEGFQKLMAKPVEGTLSDRLLNISQNVRAKTGTISGVSVLTGYVDAKSNNKYSFAILIQNYPDSSLDAKKLEDAIVNEIYTR